MTYPDSNKCQCAQSKTYKNDMLSAKPATVAFEARRGALLSETDAPCMHQMPAT